MHRLKDTRNDKDLLRKNIAGFLGISKTVYFRYERGFQTIPLEHPLVLADSYGTSADYPPGRTDHPKPYKK